jgi:ribosomal protein L29
VTPDEVREKNLQELAVLKKDLQEELFKLQMQNATGQLEKSHRLKEIKRDIARVATITAQKSGKK